MMIFFLFKPLNIKEQTFIDVPVFEIDKFMMQELSSKGLEILMIGTNATKYSNRYTVKDINFTDKTKNYIANMRADFGIYKDEILKLNGQVYYGRDDGLTFETQEVVYNKKIGIVYVYKDYVSHMGTNQVKGSSLKYNNILDTLQSTNVVAHYTIKENSK